MNRFATIALVAAAAAATGAQATTFIDNARVRTVEPQYENVTVPRNVCTTEWEQYQQPRHIQGVQQYGPAILGGVAGGLLGNQVGKGHGREAATAVGAVIGAFAGNHIGNQGGWNQQPYEQPRQVQRCQTVNEVQPRLTGYRVGYDYRGQTYSTFMRENPGQFLQVQVSVQPLVR